MADKSVFVNLDLNGQAIKNFKLEAFASAPTGYPGRNYYDATTGKVGFYNAVTSEWEYLGVVDSVVAGSSKITVDNTDPANPEIDVAVANLIDDATSTSSNIYSASKVDSQIAAALVGGAKLKGNIDCSTNPNYPAAVVGDFYLVSVAGKIGGASGINVEINDTIYCQIVSAGGTQAAVGSKYFIVQANIDGAVTGGASSTSGNIATFNGTSGKIIQDGGVAVSTDGALASNSDAKLPTEKAVKAYADTKVTSNSAITGATKTKITYDAKGLVTAGADATTADIADSLDKRYVTDADLTLVQGIVANGVLNSQLAGGITYDKLATVYASDFLSTDFATSGSDKVLTIAAATHGLGVSADLEAIVKNSAKTDVTNGVIVGFNANGNVTVTVNSGLEFNGRIILQRLA